MGRTINTVIAGDYAGRKIKVSRGDFYFTRSFQTPVLVDATTVKSYTVVDRDETKSGTSVFFRGLVGRWLFGNVGMLAGGLSAKNKTATIISVEFHNGDKSLIELDKKRYKLWMRKIFI